MELLKRSAAGGGGGGVGVGGTGRREQLSDALLLCGRGTFHASHMAEGGDVMCLLACVCVCVCVAPAWAYKITAVDRTVVNSEKYIRT